MADSVLIIGGGPAGLEAARLLGDIGVKSVIVEKRERLGGTPIFENYAALTHGFHSAEDIMNALIASVTGSGLVDVRLNTELVACEGEAGAFKVTLAKGGNGKGETVEVGSIIVATGFQHFDPGRETQVYGYYEYPDVITLADAEQATVIIGRDDQCTAHFSVFDQSTHVILRINIISDREIIGGTEGVQQSARLRRAVLVPHSQRDIFDVGRRRVSEQEQLHDRNDQRHDQCA